MSAVNIAGKLATFSKQWKPHVVASAGVPLALLLATLAGCEIPTDAATRLSADLGDGATRLGKSEGDTFTVQHRTPSKPGDCAGPYTVQLDQVGAMIIWCKDADGKTVASHSTSSHARFVDTPKTYLLDKPAGSTLVITLERHGGRPVATAVQ